MLSIEARNEMDNSQVAKSSLGAFVRRFNNSLKQFPEYRELALGRVFQNALKWLFGFCDGYCRFSGKLKL